MTIHEMRARYSPGDPYDLNRVVTPFATVHDLMGCPIPSKWRPFARRRWIRMLERREMKEMEAQMAFAVVITAITDRAENSLREAKAKEALRRMKEQP